VKVTEEECKSAYLINLLTRLDKDCGEIGWEQCDKDRQEAARALMMLYKIVIRGGLF